MLKLTILGFWSIFIWKISLFRIKQLASFSDRLFVHNFIFCGSFHFHFPTFFYCFSLILWKGPTLSAQGKSRFYIKIKFSFEWDQNQPSSSKIGRDVSIWSWSNLWIFQNFEPDFLKTYFFEFSTSNAHISANFWARRLVLVSLER